MKNTLEHLQPNPTANPTPLRYYDPELQNALNAEPFDEDRFQRARAKSKKLEAEYLNQLANLAPRLSKATYARFSDPRQPLFDSDLLAFSFGDSLHYVVRKAGRKTLKMAVQATFRSFDEKLLHFFTYRNIQALSVNLPMERWFAGFNLRIDNLISDELVGIDDNLMQHAFLFVSGAFISVICEGVRWETKRNQR